MDSRTAVSRFFNYVEHYPCKAGAEQPPTAHKPTLKALLTIYTTSCFQKAVLPRHSIISAAEKASADDERPIGGGTCPSLKIWYSCRLLFRLTLLSLSSTCTKFHTCSVFDFFHTVTAFLSCRVAMTGRLSFSAILFPFSHWNATGQERIWFLIPSLYGKKVCLMLIRQLWEAFNSIMGVSVFIFEAQILERFSK